MSHADTAGRTVPWNVGNGGDIIGECARGFYRWLMYIPRIHNNLYFWRWPYQLPEIFVLKSFTLRWQSGSCSFGVYIGDERVYPVAQGLFHKSWYGSTSISWKVRVLFSWVRWFYRWFTHVFIYTWNLNDSTIVWIENRGHWASRYTYSYINMYA